MKLVLSDFEKYLHEYAVWTAVRASQRGFTTTKNIKAAIDDSKLHHSTILNQFDTEEEFDTLHRKICKKLLANLNHVSNVSYGRVAKILNIYLKTSIIIRWYETKDKVKYIHPPIDRVLLKNIIKEYPHLKIQMCNWTELSETKYFNLIDKLRSLGLDSLWEVEKHWRAE